MESEPPRRPGSRKPLLCIPDVTTCHAAPDPLHVVHRHPGGRHGRVVYAGVDIKSRRAVVELVPPAHDPGFRCAGRDIRARPYEEIIALRPEWHAGADDKGKITIVCIVGRKDEARMSTGGPHLRVGPTA